MLYLFFTLCTLNPDPFICEEHKLVVYDPKVTVSQCQLKAQIELQRHTPQGWTVVSYKCEKETNG